MRVGNGALFCRLKYISSTLRFCAGGSFFFAVGPFGPAAFFISLSRGRVAAGVQQKPKKEPHMANGNTNPGGGETTDSEVMHNPQPSCARTHARVVSPTGILKESLTVLPGAHAREGVRTRGKRQTVRSARPMAYEEVRRRFRSRPRGSR